ncbi:MAG: lytic transglycosylase domain-containing protein [Alphaproteobacteria bacterium]|nr:lytic transglycosylase domain-containing protein [Alphaproteobacteria bacterium]
MAHPAAPQPSMQRIAGLSAFAQEQKLGPRGLIDRWNGDIALASKRFAVPAPWIRAVMQIESGGRTLAGENRPLVSSKGAQGLMQLMPSTYEDMRRDHALGGNPFDPHDNILAGAAYLGWLHQKYGYPAMFAAYNDGPGHLDQRLAQAGLLPAETRTYLVDIARALGGRGKATRLARLTRPDGSAVMIDAGSASSVRAALPEEYAPGVLSVISIGKVRQGVRENVVSARAILRAHGAIV